MGRFQKLEEVLGYTFKDPALLELALTHPSRTSEQALGVNNQRLEFLGDAVLGLIISKDLYFRYPEWEEGDLTKARARIVNSRSLAEHALEWELENHLILSKGEGSNTGKGRESALADAAEAVLGAIFLDGGFEAVNDVACRTFKRACEVAAQESGLLNPKGELQELLQVNSPVTPQYEMIAAKGPDHDREFECIVRHEGRELGRGIGKSKKEAESNAARSALEKLKTDAGDTAVVGQ